MRPTRKTQPYRATAAREQTAPLQAMLRGRGPLRQTSPGEVRRRAMKKRPTRKARARYSSPLAQILHARSRAS